MVSLFDTKSFNVNSRIAALFSSSSKSVKQSLRDDRQTSLSRRRIRENRDSSDEDDINDDPSSSIKIRADEPASTLYESRESTPKPGRSSKHSGKSVGNDAPSATAIAEDSAPHFIVETSKSSESRRKRKRADDDLEGAYMKRVAHEEEKEEQQRFEKRQKNSKRPTTTTDHDAAPTVKPLEPSSDAEDAEAPYAESEQDAPVPQHESVAQIGNPDIEQASRTVFLGNVSTTAITDKASLKALKAHLTSFFSSLPASTPPHKIESFRFRSTAYATAVPKKAAFARQELMDATTKSTNAYVVYSTKQASREATARLNGTVILDRHLRVDEVAHPAKVDHHRCIFVGNLAFVDDESQMKDTGDEAENARKRSKSRLGDVEEGLWRQFGKAGTVESVRVVRDAKTRVSKGFAYVQFTHENAVEAALLFNDKKFPPLLPRTLRVVRAKKFKKSDTRPTADAARTMSKSRKSAAPGAASQQGRAKKLLGRAGAARGGDRPARRTGANDTPVGRTGINGTAMRKPESFVFEGHRASSSQGNSGVKLGRTGGGKKKGRPTDRSAKRGAAWKTKGREGKEGAGK